MNFVYFCFLFVICFFDITLVVVDSDIVEVSDSVITYWYCCIFATNDRIPYLCGSAYFCGKSRSLLWPFHSMVHHPFVCSFALNSWIRLIKTRIQLNSWIRLVKLRRQLRCYKFQIRSLPKASSNAEKENINFHIIISSCYPRVGLCTILYRYYCVFLVLQSRWPCRSRRQSENLIILLGDDVSTEEAVIFPCEDEILEMLTGCDDDSMKLKPITELDNFVPN